MSQNEGASGALDVSLLSEPKQFHKSNSTKENTTSLIEENVNKSDETAADGVQLDSFSSKQSIHYEEEVRTVQSSLSKFSRTVSYSIEHTFFWYGKSVATFPGYFILVSLIFTAICSIGLIAFETENRPFKLWIPQDSDFIKVGEWQKKNFRNDYRFHAVIYEADNVLNKNVLLELLQVHAITVSTVALVSNINLTNSSSEEQESYKERNVTWTDVCTKLPSLMSLQLFGRRKRDTRAPAKLDISYDVNLSVNDFNSDNVFDYYSYNFNSTNDTQLLSKLKYASDVYDIDIISAPRTKLSSKIMSAELVPMSVNRSIRQRVTRQSGLDWSTYLPRGSYCTLLEQISSECFEMSLLELWGYDHQSLEALTQQEIIDVVNSKNLSAVFGYSKNFTDYLGGITRDENGKIIGAKATIQTFLTKINHDQLINGKNIDEFGSGVEVDEHVINWEKKFVEHLLEKKNNTGEIKLYIMSALSFREISKEAIDGDLNFFIFGYVVVFIFVQIMLGKFNIVETRPWLSFLGISAVQLSIVISYGLASACGYKFGPVNHILPFLLLGLGIDDMFVIVQSFGEFSVVSSYLNF